MRNGKVASLHHGLLDKNQKMKFTFILPLKSKNIFSEKSGKLKQILRTCKNMQSFLVTLPKTELDYQCLKEDCY